MIIKFPRHAKRRAKLSNISENIVINILENLTLSEGEHEIIRDVVGFKYPLKIVVTVENDIATVVTNYPLKKGRRS